jgi:hypothetical protein
MEELFGNQTVCKISDLMAKQSPVELPAESTSHASPAEISGIYEDFWKHVTSTK